jgi:hypothetical protein
MNRTLLAVAALSLAGAPGALADVLVMEDGRRIQGELISVNRGQVIFDEAQPGSFKPRRLRLEKDEVARIVLRDNAVQDDVDMATRDEDPVEDGPFGRNRDQGTDDRYPRETDDRYPRETDDRYPREPEGRTPSTRDRMVSVPASRAWTDTGLDVAVGDVIRFAAEGIVQRGPGQEDGPGGEMNSPINERRPVPSRPAGALIGRIGTSPSDVFFIGSDRGGFRVRTTGRLYLGVNDHYHVDNSGSFEVRVSR